MLAFVFTKTMWSEPPRIRHDITKLLRKIGFKIHFFQRPTLFWHKNKGNITVENDFILVHNKELLHHQLRPIQLFSRLNAKYEIRQLNACIQPDVVFNFNYDYYWLRDIYHDTPIITIINDEFVISAKPWMKHEARRVEEKTVKKSDACLAVSIPIFNKCMKYNKNSFLFLPWAPHLCKSERIYTRNQKLLYWGYISSVTDFEILKYLSQNGIQIDMIGPIVNNTVSSSDIKGLETSGIHILNPVSFKELSEVSNRYYATVLPYRRDIDIGQSVTMSNRGFKLLALGLPLIYADMPYLLDAPRNVIWKCKTKEDFLEAAKTLKHARPTQAINTFLFDHLESNRKDQLISILSEIKGHRRILLENVAKQQNTDR